MKVSLLYYFFQHSGSRYRLVCICTKLRIYVHTDESGIRFTLMCLYYCPCECKSKKHLFTIRIFRQSCQHRSHLRGLFKLNLNIVKANSVTIKLCIKLKLHVDIPRAYIDTLNVKRQYINSLY